jgi:hypothetical protein
MNFFFKNNDTIKIDDGEREIVSVCKTKIYGRNNRGRTKVFRLMDITKTSYEPEPSINKIITFFDHEMPQWKSSNFRNEDGTEKKN